MYDIGECRDLGIVLRCLSNEDCIRPASLQRLMSSWELVCHPTHFGGYDFFICISLTDFRFLVLY